MTYFFRSKRNTPDRDFEKPQVPRKAEGMDTFSAIKKGPQ
jgi:hypothetical protein